ncbi:hypothetical protein ACFL2Q_07845 [Thermodesulfobacteriota bacterium]
MPIRQIMVIVAIVSISCLLVTPGFCEPVKWSAPMSAYPKQWSPTAPPPSYYNPYGYQYPYGAYGYGPQAAYGAYPGYGAYGGHGYNQAAYSGRHTGNPYLRYYGQ